MVRYEVTTSQDIEVEGLPCTCFVGLQGNFCKHRAKILLMSGMADVQIVKKYGTHYGRDVETPCVPTATQNQVGPTQCVHCAAYNLIHLRSVPYKA